MPPILTLIVLVCLDFSLASDPSAIGNNEKLIRQAVEKLQNQTEPKENEREKRDPPTDPPEVTTIDPEVLAAEKTKKEEKHLADIADFELKTVPAKTLKAQIPKSRPKRAGIEKGQERKRSAVPNLFDDAEDEEKREVSRSHRRMKRKTSDPEAISQAVKLLKATKQTKRAGVAKGADKAGGSRRKRLTKVNRAYDVVKKDSEGTTMVKTEPDQSKTYLRSIRGQTTVLKRGKRDTKKQFVINITRRKPNVTEPETPKSAENETSHHFNETAPVEATEAYTPLTVDSHPVPTSTESINLNSEANHSKETDDTSDEALEESSTTDEVSDENEADGYSAKLGGNSKKPMTLIRKTIESTIMFKRPKRYIPIKILRKQAAEKRANDPFFQKLAKTKRNPARARHAPPARPRAPEPEPPMPERAPEPAAPVEAAPREAKNPRQREGRERINRPDVPARRRVNPAESQPDARRNGAPRRRGGRRRRPNRRRQGKRLRQRGRRRGQGRSNQAGRPGRRGAQNMPSQQFPENGHQPRQPQNMPNQHFPEDSQQQPAQRRPQQPGGRPMHQRGPLNNPQRRARPRPSFSAMVRKGMRSPRVRNAFEKMSNRIRGGRRGKLPGHHRNGMGNRMTGTFGRMRNAAGFDQRGQNNDWSIQPQQPIRHAPVHDYPQPGGPPHFGYPPENRGFPGDHMSYGGNQGYSENPPVSFHSQPQNPHPGQYGGMHGFSNDYGSQFGGQSQFAGDYPSPNDHSLSQTQNSYY